MRVLGVVLVSVVALLAGCSGGVKSAKLSEMSDPKISQQMLELSAEERGYLVAYMVIHAADLNYKTTIGEAIKEGEKLSKTP
jgi:tetrahydromethanopterin S-methyltransferase subunit C